MRNSLKSLAVFLFLASTPAFAQETPPTATMSMNGLGEVTAAPDIAFINSGVITDGATAAEALAANSAAMNELIGVLKSASIEERDIQTSHFTVQPQYVYSDKRDANGYTEPPKIVGYQVSNSVTVRVRDLDALGTILDQVVAVGANNINSISFSVDKPDALLDEARRQAMADAVEKAELYAGAANVTLGRILEISESGGFAPQPAAMKVMRESFAADASAVPVQAGELTYSINVYVRWELAE